MKYWVCESLFGRKTALVHEETCIYCNYGEGLSAGSTSARIKWHGPFDTGEDAYAFAKTLEDRTARYCKVCVPEKAAAAEAAEAKAAAETDEAAEAAERAEAAGVAARERAEAEATALKKAEAEAAEAAGMAAREKAEAEQEAREKKEKKPRRWLKWLLLAIALIVVVLLLFLLLRSCGNGESVNANLPDATLTAMPVETFEQAPLPPAPTETADQAMPSPAPDETPDVRVPNFDEIKAVFPGAALEDGRLTLPDANFDSFAAAFPGVSLDDLEAVFGEVTFGGTENADATDVLPEEDAAESGPVADAPPDGQAEDTSVAGTYRVTANLRLRSGPSTDSDSLITIPKGSVIEVVGAAYRGSNWYLTEYNGMQGYCYRQYLEIQP